MKKLPRLQLYPLCVMYTTPAGVSNAVSALVWTETRRAVNRSVTELYHPMFDKYHEEFGYDEAG